MLLVVAFHLQSERHGRFQTCEEKAKFFGAGSGPPQKKAKKEKGAAKTEEPKEEEE